MTDETAPAPQTVPAKRTFVPVHSDTALFDTAKFEQIARVAQAAYRGTYLPEHLRTDEQRQPLAPDAVQANCFIVASMASDYGVGFMTMAMCISQVHGRVMFEGKFIAAMIERRLGFKLVYEYTGEPGTDAYGITVSTEQDAASHFHPISGTVAEWATKEKNGNRKTIWVGPNKQKMQLAYMGARVWCRLNAPGLMIGVYGADEFDAEAPASSSPPVDLEISAGFGAPKSIEHKPAGIDVAAELARTAAATGKEQELVSVTHHGDGSRSVTSRDRVVDEKQDQQASSSESSPKGLETKGGKRGRKPAPAGLSPAMRSALDIARAEVDDIGGQLSKAHPGDEPMAWRMEVFDVPADDDAAQALLGRFNAYIDRGRRQLLEIEAARAGQQDQGTDDDEPESPPPPPPPPVEKPTVDQILRNLGDVMRPQKTWPEIKATFSNFSRQHEWREFDQPAKAKCYRMVWEFANALNVAKLSAGEPWEVQPTADATAFRCALECCDDAGVLEHMWEQVTTSESYMQQAQPTKDALAASTMARIEKLKAGA